MSFTSLLGIIVGNSIFRLGALISVFFFAICAVLLLLADRRNLLRTSTRYRRLLARYCEFIADDPRPTVLIKHWDQVVTIAPDGDAHEFVTIQACSLREDLYFLTLRIGPSWDQPQKFRDRVKVTIRSLLVDGNVGTSWDVTSSWLHDGRINLLAHLHEPVKRGSEMTIRMERIWPGKCLPLMRNHHPDEFILKFSESMPIESARYLVTLPAGTDSHYEPIGFDLSDTNFSLSAGKDKEDRPQYILTTKAFEANRRLGMRLELKQTK